MLEGESLQWINIKHDGFHLLHSQCYENNVLLFLMSLWWNFSCVPWAKIFIIKVNKKMKIEQTLVRWRNRIVASILSHEILCLFVFIRLETPDNLASRLLLLQRYSIYHTSIPNWSTHYLPFSIILTLFASLLTTCERTMLLVIKGKFQDKRKIKWH